MNIRKYIAAIFIIALIVPPILAGLWISVSASFGHFPALGLSTFTIEPWRALWMEPGFWGSLRATLISGFLSTFLALTLALIGCFWFQKPASEQRISRFISPILAAPHSAMAIGFAFMIAPSGWVIRVISPWATGFETPPQITTTNDTFGIALAFALAIKELPFLFFIALGAMRQLPIRAQMETASALGYAPKMAWLKIVLPQIYARIKLPVFIVLVFGISNVDMAVILGPTHPPTLAVMALHWFHSPQIEYILPASAASMLLLFIALAAIVFWTLLVKISNGVFETWIEKSDRDGLSVSIFSLTKFIIILSIFCGICAFVLLVIWSFTWRWSFPNMLPETYSAMNWLRSVSNWLPILWTSILIAVSSATISLVICILWFELARGTGLRSLEWMFYLPLIIPQIAFLFGVNTILTKLGAHHQIPNTIWAHCLFVFPYAFIALAHPWRNIDPRFVKTATALGASSFRVLWSVRIPIMLRPISIAFAISISVSIAQYLPTLFVGGGRVVTLTTEAITLASGSDRRIAGVYAVLQSLFPLIMFALASLIPIWVFNNRKDMHGGTN